MDIIIHAISETLAMATGQRGKALMVLSWLYTSAFWVTTITACAWISKVLK